MGSTLLTNPYGCVQSQGDTQITLKILTGLLANPNVHSVLIVGLGCETMQKDMYLEAVEERSPGKRVEYISIQQCGGIGRTVARGISIVQELMAEAEKCKREPCPIGELMHGLSAAAATPPAASAPTWRWASSPTGWSIWAAAASSARPSEAIGCRAHPQGPRRHAGDRPEDL